MQSAYNPKCNDKGKAINFVLLTVKWNCL